MLLQTTMKQGGTRTPACAPQLVRLVIVAVEGLQRGLQFNREAERVKICRLAAALPGHPRANVLPEVAELGHVAAGNVVGHRHARQLDDAAFNGVHQRKVAHGPGEQSAFGIARSAEEERRRGEIDDPCDAELSLDDFQTGDPEPRSLVVLLSLLLVITFQIGLAISAGLFTVAVMSLIVEHQDVLQAHEARHHPLDHLPFGFQRVQLFAATLEQGAPALRKLHTLTKLEGMVVRDHDLGAVEIAKHVAGDQFTALVIAIWVVGLEYAEAVADGQAGRDDQESRA